MHEHRWAKKCNLTLAMGPTCQSNNTMFICHSWSPPHSISGKPGKFQTPSCKTFWDMNYYPVTDGQTDRQTESDAYAKCNLTLLWAYVPLGLPVINITEFCFHLGNSNFNFVASQKIMLSHRDLSRIQKVPAKGLKHGLRWKWPGMSGWQ